MRKNENYEMFFAFLFKKNETIYFEVSRAKIDSLIKKEHYQKIILFKIF